MNLNIFSQVSVVNRLFRGPEILKAEKSICRLLNFDFYGEEVATFLDRFILAARKEGDEIFRVLCMFLLDCIVS